MKKQHFLSLLFCLFGCLFAQAAGITNPVTPQADSCDVVAFKNGRILRTKVLSVSKTDIKFRDCGDANAAEISHDVDDVLSILYSNGSTVDFSDNAANSRTESNKSRTNAAKGSNTASKAKGGAAIFGILALVACFLGIFVGAIPLGICAIILGAVGMYKSKKLMDKTGNTIGVLGVVLGAIILLLGLIGLASRV